MEGRRGLGEGSGEKQGSLASQTSGRVQKPGGGMRAQELPGECLGLAGPGRGLTSPA